MSHLDNLHHDCEQARALILEALEEASFNLNDSAEFIRLRMQYPSTYMRVYAQECMERFLAAQRDKQHFVAVQGLHSMDRFYFFEPSVLVRATMRGFAQANAVFRRENVVSMSMIDYSMKRSLNVDDGDGVQKRRKEEA